MGNGTKDRGTGNGKGETLRRRIVVLYDAMAISRRMRRIALQSIGVGLGVSFALMVVASFGLLSPAAGAVLQEALDAGVILNALRVR